MKVSVLLKLPPQLTKITETCSIFLIFFQPNNFLAPSWTHKQPTVFIEFRKTQQPAITDKIQKKQHILPFDCCRMEVKKEAKYSAQYYDINFFLQFQVFLITLSFLPSAISNKFFLFKSRTMSYRNVSMSLFPFFTHFHLESARISLSLLFSAKYIEWRCESHWCSGMFSSVKLNKLTIKIFEDEMREKSEGKGKEWTWMIEVKWRGWKRSKESSKWFIA